MKILGLLVSDKNIFKSFSDVKKNWPFHKKGQGQSKVIIVSQVIGPMFPMPHTKPQAHWTFGSGEDSF